MIGSLEPFVPEPLDRSDHLPVDRQIDDLQAYVAQCPGPWKELMDESDLRMVVGAIRHPSRVGLNLASPIISRMLCERK